MYDKITGVLAKKGINVEVGNIYDMQQMWHSWYRGNVNDFHYYNTKTVDGKNIRCERLTMNMAKKICEDHTKLLWSEKVEINLDDDGKQEILDEVLKENNFYNMFGYTVEKMFALGTSAIVEYLDNGKVKIDYITGDKLIPYKTDSGNITGLITYSQTKSGEYYENLLTYHEFSDGLYTKYHELYVSEEDTDLGELADFEAVYGFEPYLEYETEYPHFQVIKPNIANNFDDGCMGISVFANSIDKLKAIDIKYDSFSNEFELGKKRILVDRMALKDGKDLDADGNIVNVSYFDKNDRSFMAINGMENQPVKEIDFSLRTEEHINSLNSELSFLSAGVGLGQQFYSFDSAGLKTATEVISEKSDTYRTKTHNQIIIEDALYKMVKSILFLLGIDSEVNIKFDDSIIEDEQAKIDRGLELLRDGVISKQTFLIDYMGYTEDMAKEELEKVREDNRVITPEGLDFFGQE